MGAGLRAQDTARTVREGTGYHHRQPPHAAAHAAASIFPGLSAPPILTLDPGGLPQLSGTKRGLFLTSNQLSRHPLGAPTILSSSVTVPPGVGDRPQHSEGSVLQVRPRYRAGAPRFRHLLGLHRLEQPWPQPQRARPGEGSRRPPQLGSLCRGRKDAGPTPEYAHSSRTKDHFPTLTGDLDRLLAPSSGPAPPQPVKAFELSALKCTGGQSTESSFPPRSLPAGPRHRGTQRFAPLVSPTCSAPRPSQPPLTTGLGPGLLRGPEWVIAQGARVRTRGPRVQGRLLGAHVPGCGAGFRLRKRAPWEAAGGGPVPTRLAWPCAGCGWHLGSEPEDAGFVCLSSKTR